MTLQESVRRIAATEDEMFRETLNEAADRIDELEAALRDIIELDHEPGLYKALGFARIARKALEASS